MNRTLRTALPVFVVALALGLLGGFFMPRDDDFFALKKNFTIFGELYEELATGYVDDLDAEQLMRTGIDAMLQTLDPYTVFIDEADNEDIDIITRGRYGGVGLTVGQRGGKTVVLQPVEGASAFEQGVRTGDVITHIAGTPTEGLTSDEIRDFLRGDPGTTVEIRIEREGELEPLDFRLTRSEVQLKNVTYADYLDAEEIGSEGIGYVKLERFARDAASEVEQAVLTLQREGELRGLVLDLRGNPGGLLEAAVEISGLFLPQGAVVVSTRGRLAESERVYRSRSAPITPASSMRKAYTLPRPWAALGAPTHRSSPTRASAAPKAARGEGSKAAIVPDRAHSPSSWLKRCTTPAPDCAPMAPTATVEPATRRLAPKRSLGCSWLIAISPSAVKPEGPLV